MIGQAIARTSRAMWSLAENWRDARYEPGVLARYGFALVAIAVAMLVLQLVGGQFEIPTVLLGAVVLSALFGGTGPGVLATVLAAIAFRVFFIRRFVPADETLFAWLPIPRAVFSYTLAGLIVTFLSAAQRSAARTAHDANRKLDRKVHELESANVALENEIVERKCSERLRTAQYALARVLAEANSLADAAPRVLEAIGDNLGWDWGALWSFDPKTRKLHCGASWCGRGLPLADFDAVSRVMIFTPGEGRVGRIWQDGTPDWSSDITKRSEVMRCAVAEKAGLHASVAVPIRLDAHCLGVVEFFSRERYECNDAQLDALATIGGQIGQFIKRKEAEAAVAESERHWRTIFDMTGVGVVTLGADLRYRSANKRFQEMLGYSEEEIRALTPIEITYDEDRELAQKAVTEIQELRARAMRGGAKALEGVIYPQIERRLRRKNGDIIWVAIDASVVPASDQEPDTFAAVILDITERKRMEEMLQLARTDLWRRNRIMLLGEMAASIAHEINQPIAAVITSANAGTRWLGADPPDLSEVRETLERIVRDGNRAAEVISRIRALVRKQPAQANAIDLNESVRDVVGMLRTELHNSGIQCRLELFSALPPAAFDRVQLQQVLMNLLVNAIEAMGAVHDRSREITILTRQVDADHVGIEVRDNGPGFDPAVVERLFTSFYTTKAEGMGMGLAICRSIVEAHGGAISAAAAEPFGALFRFTLPIGQAAPAQGWTLKAAS